MRFLVVGAGSWGTAFTRVLLDRGHDVVLACHTAEQAEAIVRTGWNPRYLQSVDLRGVRAVALAEAPGDADVARKADCATLVVLSKWDSTTMSVDETRGQLRRRLRQRPPFVAVSAHTGRGLERLLDGVAALFDKHTSRISTPELNRALAELREARQPPARGARRLNLLYGAQIHARPPRFRFFVNDPGLVTRDYGYWVENELRERFGLDGVPVSIDFVRRS